MTTVFAQVGGDAISAGCLGQKGRAQRVGQGTATGVADGCHMIDIDAQP
jgi:hypothetical protein